MDAADDEESHGKLVPVSEQSEFQFHLVFSNKTQTDAYCLEVWGKLTAQGVQVWQQQKNIPKDSDNWFNEWYPSAAKSIKIVCFLTTAYLKSPYCMKEFGIAQAKDKLLVVACEPVREITSVDPSKYPHASNALAYLEGGGQVIFHDTDDVVAEIMKFIPRQAAAAAPEPEPEPVASPVPPTSSAAWPKELQELVGIPSFAACLAGLDVHSLEDFAAEVDVEEGHDKQMQAVLTALPSKPKKNRQKKNRAQATLSDLLLRLKLFEEYDSNDDGALSKAEVEQIPVEKMVTRKSKAALSEAFNALDADQDGLLSFEEMFAGAEVVDGEGVPPAVARQQAEAAAKVRAAEEAAAQEKAALLAQVDAAQQKAAQLQVEKQAAEAEQKAAAEEASVALARQLQQQEEMQLKVVAAAEAQAAAEARAAAALAEPEPEPAPAKKTVTLATSVSPDGGSGYSDPGVYFDVRSDGPAVTLTALTGGANYNGDRQVTIWACEGEGAGKETERGAWRQVGAGTLKTQKSTRVALSSPVAVGAGATVGLFVHSTSHGVCFTKEGGAGGVDASDGAISVLKGKYTIEEEPFASCKNIYTTLAGSVEYELGAAPAAAAAGGAAGPVVSTEAQLVAALQGDGRATVAAGVTIELTKPLVVCDDPSNVQFAEQKHVVQRDSVSIVAAAGGGGATIVGPPQHNRAPGYQEHVMDCSSTLVMQGLAVEARGDSSAVYCCKEGHAELSGCKLTSPEGTGLWVDGNYGSATVTMDGGAISGCGEYGVYCTNSTATLRGVTVDRNGSDYEGGGKIVVDGVERERDDTWM